MIKDNVGNVFYEGDDLIHIAYKYGLESWDKVTVLPDDYINEYNQNITRLGFPKINTRDVEQTTIEDVDRANQQAWFYDDEYENINVLDFCLHKCNTLEEIERVKFEYTKFEYHNMIHILKYVIFLVDKMNETGVILGVGRGSAVSSYILYLIGIHKINPLIHELDVNEFFKEY